MKINKKIIFLIPMLLSFCQKQNLNYHKVFQASLGFKQHEIGSNIPILENYTNRSGFPDSVLVDIPKFYIRDEKIYIADSYNKRISVFNLDKNMSKSHLVLSIPNKGKNYSFARPYEVYVDRYNNIYVLASEKDLESYEVQHYSNQTAGIQNYDQFQKEIENISPANFYIYKFSSRGDFVYRIGSRGINADPIIYPIKISGDNFGNIYTVFPIENFNDPEMNSYLLMKKYSKQGQLTFEFNTKTLNIVTNINNTNYRGHVISIDNFQHDEQLAMLVEFQPTTNNNKEQVLPHIDNVWSSVNIYSILANDFTQEVLRNKDITDSVLGIDQFGKIYFQSYSENTDSLKIRVLDTKDNKEEQYLVPIQSSYYTLFDYFIDSDGNIYNYLLDRKKKVMVLQWKIKDSE